MFESDFEPPLAVISIVTKGDFGKTVANAITLPSTEDLGIQYFSIQEITPKLLSDSDLVFVVADKLSQEEWAKIYQPTQTLIITVGCSAPISPVPDNSFFINESSVKLCSKTISSIMNAIWGEGLFQVYFADIIYILAKCGDVGFSSHVPTVLVENAAIEALKQLSDKPILLQDIKGVLVNITGNDKLELYEIEAIVSKLLEELNKDVDIIIAALFEPTIEDNKVDLNVIWVV